VSEIYYKIKDQHFIAGGFRLWQERGNPTTQKGGENPKNDRLGDYNQNFKEIVNAA
jgi:hypothetical protein